MPQSSIPKPGPTEPHLELPGGKQQQINRTCSIGRSEANSIALHDEKVSRRHALITEDPPGQFWISDLGSRNGTMINGRRLAQTTRLVNGDVVEIGSNHLVFRNPGDPAEESIAATGTLVQVRTRAAWLLVGDLVDSTSLVQRLPAADIPETTGKWLADCRTAIETQGGFINKFLGDGWLACWWDDQGAVREPVAKAVKTLSAIQDHAKLPFRMVLHHGDVLSGGLATPGEEPLTGRAVHLVFRLEKLAGQLKEPRVASQETADALAGHLKFTSLGSHPLHGFDGIHPIHRF